jgi:GNAT superfamily N-acetyltransferase
MPENLSMTGFRVATIAERPELLGKVQELGGSAWPRFLGHDETVNEWWRYLWELMPEYQFVLIEERSDDVLACGNAVPIVWDQDPGTLPEGGVDAVLPAAIEAIESGSPPSAASALMVVVREDMRGRGLSGACLEAMRGIATVHDLASLVAPVRPVEKHRYPLVALEEYARWRRPDGSHFDPWLRVHEQAGAVPVGVAPSSMRVSGTVGDWEDWTDMLFPGTGSYVVPGALVPVEIDRDRDEGVYVEPNLWMHHVLV